MSSERKNAAEGANCARAEQPYRRIIYPTPMLRLCARELDIGNTAFHLTSRTNTPIEFDLRAASVEIARRTCRLVANIDFGSSLVVSACEGVCARVAGRFGLCMMGVDCELRSMRRTVVWLRAGSLLTGGT